MMPDGEARQGQIGRNRDSAGRVCQSPGPDEAQGYPHRDPRRETWAVSLAARTRWLAVSPDQNGADTNQ